MKGVIIKKSRLYAYQVYQLQTFQLFLVHLHLKILIKETWKFRANITRLR